MREYTFGGSLKVYYVTIGKNEYQIEIGDHDIKINGESVNASLVALKEYGIHLLKKGFDRREIYVKGQGNSKYVVNTLGSNAVVNVEKKSLAQTQSAAKNTGDISAPLPGKIMSVQVKPGDQVQEGQVLVVMESMKMQMMLNAAADGVVARVDAVAGSTVAKDDLLVVFEDQE